MSYSVLATKRFQKDFVKLSVPDQDAVRRKCKELETGPEQHKHLRHSLAGSVRLRVGKLRVIFSIERKRQEVYLERIVKRHRY